MTTLKIKGGERRSLRDITESKGTQGSIILSLKCVSKDNYLASHLQKF